ncbi:hypothetical protein QAD02_001195 [Eretmocerus hayati]|uniref:Uncharacterized protein n=1 Tax=Eretmocerus hayati TaxID=131215 RepID=A0ACC2NFT3_9HYME|nr:hypothetical protein QAD02_001195 [Eretmocerus hayati]
MSQAPQEAVRSEVEEGLSGPANSLTAESIDCGCGLYRLPQLVKFATRRVFLTILCSIGAIQGAAHAYLHVTSPTIARKFNFDPYLIEWITCVSEIAPVFLGLLIAYWGDRIHRAAWLGGLTLIQCAAFMCYLAPHLSPSHRENNDSDQAEHISMYTEGSSQDSSDLCKNSSSKIMEFKDPPDYVNVAIFIGIQIVTAIANIAYYSLGISYLDDNTKRLHIPIYFGVVVSAKLIGNALGHLMGWGFLRIDADNFSSVVSYRNQIGAWWLGWPIFTILLLVPGILMAIFPRKLPSKMVEEAASTILDQSRTLRGSQRLTTRKVGSTKFFPSILRIIRNKILVCNVISAAFLMTALINLVSKDSIFLESRFHVPRPTGMLSGFGDPLLSRIFATIMRPLVVGLVIIIAGFFVARVKPKARTLITYELVILSVSALIIFFLSFDDCEKRSLYVAHKRYSKMEFTGYCNKNCGCPSDSDFRPVCDSQGSYTFYSPCHAGCTTVDNSSSTTTYSNCTCIESAIGSGFKEAIDGPCGLDSCQFGWLMYQLATILVYSAAASTVIGNLLVNLRSGNVQDEALTIGYTMMIIGLFAYIPGKIGYDKLTDSTCEYWGDSGHTCRLYNSKDVGNYLCFLTAALIIVSALFKIGTWFLSQNLEMYGSDETETQQPRELQDMSRTQAEPLLQQPNTSAEPDEANDDARIEVAAVVIEPVRLTETKKLGKSENGPISELGQGEDVTGSRLQYGPVGPGDRRTTRYESNSTVVNASTDDELDNSNGGETLRKGSTTQVSYKQLGFDSDGESDLSGTITGSRKRIPSDDIEILSKPPQRIRPSLSHHRFPNPYDYENVKITRRPGMQSSSFLPGDHGTPEISPKTQDQFNKQLSISKGDFNELGIPLVESYSATIKGSTRSLKSPTTMMSMQYLERNPHPELFGQISLNHDHEKPSNIQEMEENRQFRLDKLMQPGNFSPVGNRPPSRDQASSGFGSLQDMREKMRLTSDISDSKESLSSKSSIAEPSRKGGPLCTNL